jgi:hypothetical protein
MIIMMDYYLLYWYPPCAMGLVDGMLKNFRVMIIPAAYHSSSPPRQPILVFYRALCRISKIMHLLHHDLVRLASDVSDGEMVVSSSHNRCNKNGLYVIIAVCLLVSSLDWKRLQIVRICWNIRYIYYHFSNNKGSYILTPTCFAVGEDDVKSHNWGY